MNSHYGDEGPKKDEFSGEDVSYHDQAYVLNDEPSSKPEPLHDPVPPAGPVAAEEPVDGTSGVDHRPFDEVFAEEDHDLKELYVQNPGEGKNRLVIHEGLPEPQQRRTFAIRLVLFIIVILGVLSLPLFIPMKLIDQEGYEQSVPLWSWLIKMKQMPDSQRALQGLSGEERRYLVDRERVFEVSSASYQYFANTGVWPRTVGELVREELVSEEATRDTNGFELKLNQKNGEMAVISVGEDGRVGGSDDISYFMGDWQVPAKFESKKLDEALLQ